LDADYRLWIDFEPLDAHMHVSGRAGELGLYRYGVGWDWAGIVSWITALDRVGGWYWSFR
jgi:hypothetical protein